MNSLQHLDDFKTVLQDYRPSDEALGLLRDTRLVLLVGPTSSGRNTIINRLLESAQFHSVISDTTRKPRENNGVLEQNGREYWFRTEEEMLDDLRNGRFLEAAVIHEQQVSGISVRELSAAAQQGLVSINEIEVVGADNVHAAKPDALFIFVLPPSFDEWMTRMTARGSLPVDEIRRRLSSAVSELTTALERDFYTFVVNDTFNHTAARIQAIVDGQPTDNAQTINRAVAQQLVIDTKAYLEAMAQ